VVAFIFVVVGSFFCLFGFRFDGLDGFLGCRGIEDSVFSDIVLTFPQKGLCFPSDEPPVREGEGGEGWIRLALSQATSSSPIPSGVDHWGNPIRMPMKRSVSSAAFRIDLKRSHNAWRAGGGLRAARTSALNSGKLRHNKFPPENNLTPIGLYPIAIGAMT